MIYPSLYIFMYIYIYRERERREIYNATIYIYILERERDCLQGLSLSGRKGDQGLAAVGRPGRWR